MRIENPTNPAYTQSRKFVLILGAPRSGTTLLASMIAMHSDVAMLIEDRFFSVKRIIGKNVIANKLCIPTQIELTKRAGYVTRSLKKLGFFINYTSSKFNIEDYLKLKNIKVITIIRDGNDVISSIMKRGKKESRIARERWERAGQIIYELNTKYPEKTVTISYEDLVTDPESLINKIADFIGIDFQPQMLEGYKHNILYPGESGINKEKAIKPKNATPVNGAPQISTAAGELYKKLIAIKINP